ncbi:hypothetical protein AVMA1855_06670 [Acidovorax sp. SUPP1855]|uniref:TubC N-terminal docking domain-related protein n=1 Tax=Acidovorax sp. SUPP1855 TaxID=431774 RepID=UPI0023DE4E5B|nr:hypothetical protein [Acidovorax sp. SUPP1855]GKS83808.1 hypothetical protein AVMA1855_06670 [Acidovorax sp. SUPP1855]
MNDHAMQSATPASALLTRLQQQGFSLSTTPDNELQVRPASVLDDGLRAAIAQHKPALIALLQGGEVLADDRRRCRDCYHLQTAGNCSMAALGRLPGVPRWYLPAKDVQGRCHLFCALPY